MKNDDIDCVNPWQWQDAYAFAQGRITLSTVRLLHCAGQTATDVQGRLQHAGDIQAQTALALDNLEQVLTSAGATLADVVRLTYYVTDVQAHFAAFESLKARLDASGCRPASTLLGVAGLFHPDALIEIEATAALPEPTLSMDSP